MHLRYVVFFLLFFLLAPVAAKADEVVSLEQYLELVQSNNQGLQANIRHLEAAYYGVLASVGYQRPSLSAGASGSYLTKQGSSAFEEKNITAANIEVTLSWHISLSDAYSLDERQQILNYESQRARFDDSVNSLIAQAEEAYWSAVFARENIALQKSILNQRMENKGVTEEKYNQRLVPRLDFIRAESQVVAAKSLVSQAETQYRNLLSTMAGLVGRIKVVPIEESFTIPIFNLTTNIEKAIPSIPKVRAERLAFERSQIVKKLTAKGLSPTLDFGVSWTPFADPWNSSNPQKGEMAASLRLNIPIVDGNETKYKTLNADRSVLATEATLKSVEDSINIEFEIALSNWENALILERDKKLQVERSNDELSITELLYREGMGAQIDLINAQTENQQVRTDYLNAVKDMQIALIELRKILGKYTQRGNRNEKIW